MAILTAATTATTPNGQRMARLMRLPRWLMTREGLGFLLLLVVALAIRIAGAIMWRRPGDMRTYAYWGQLLWQHFFDLYSYGATLKDPNLVPVYEPFAMYVFGAIDAIYFGTAHLFGLSPSHDTLVNASWRVAVKLPGILADMGLISLVYAMGRRLLTPLKALLATATLAFTPAILVDVLYWAQTDTFILALAIGGLVFAVRRQGLLAGLLLGLAFSFKPQGGVVLPIALVYLYRSDGWKSAARAVASFAGITILTFVPYMLPPNFEIMAFVNNASATIVREGAVASHNAANIWFLRHWWYHPVSGPALGPISLQQISDVLVLGVILVTAAGVWLSPTPARFWAGAALLSLGFFDVATLQFNRYIIPAIGLFLIASLYDRRYWAIYGVVSFTAFANIYEDITICRCDPITQHIPRALDPMLTLHTDYFQLGFINVALFLIGLALYARGLWAHRRPVVEPVAAAATGMAVETAGYVPLSTSVVSTVAPDLTAVSSTMSREDTLDLTPREVGPNTIVSVVIPCYNEEGNIRPMYERLVRTLGPLGMRYELVFVENGSHDGSAALLRRLAKDDPNVSVLTLSRNFGSQGAYTSGLEYASGDCVICLDGDIQDPPELIPALIDQWRAGYDVVYGERVRRRGSLVRRVGYKVFYRLLRRLSYVEIPVDAGDFGLMDRRVVAVLNEMPERNRLIRGLRAWAGFRQIGVPYVRQDRVAGRTTNSIIDLFRWAGTGIISFSFAPLDLISYLAIGVVGLAAVAIAIYTALYFIVPNAPRGFQTLLVAVLFLGAVQLLCLSIIGAYLGKMFEELKGRPKYLVQSVQNDHRTQGYTRATGLDSATDVPSRATV